MRSSAGATGTILTPLADTARGSGALRTFLLLLGLLLSLSFELGLEDCKPISIWSTIPLLCGLRRFCSSVSWIPPPPDCAFCTVAAPERLAVLRDVLEVFPDMVDVEDKVDELTRSLKAIIWSVSGVLLFALMHAPSIPHSCHRVPVCHRTRVDLRA